MSGEECGGVVWCDLAVVCRYSVGSVGVRGVKGRKTIKCICCR